MQFLLDHSISYHPENLFEDVQTTVYNLHTSGQIHKEIASNLGEGKVGRGSSISSSIDLFFQIAIC